MEQAQQEKNLLQRIARLGKQNQDLMTQIRELTARYEELLERFEKHQLPIEGEVPALPHVEAIVVSPRKFRMVTVLFAEVHGFAKIDAKKDASGLMDQLDHLYLEFDQIMEKYRCVKIKTIGDTLMCAGGIPDKNITNPVDVVMSGLEMMHLVMPRGGGSRYNDQGIWDFRVGIHTGSVSAMVGGRTKGNFELKGDTINVASRLESFGITGKLLITVMTYELVKEFFRCEYYGHMPVKYAGNIEVFEVLGLKEELSADEHGFIPNQQFYTRYSLMQFTDLQEIILDRLEKELPQHLYYHNVKHTVDVVTEVELIGWAEGVSDEEILLLKTAALFHDAGHIIAYDEHEMHGTTLAREYLPMFHYSAEQIERICQLIMATKLPPEPKDLLEAIICDSDLDYLGRSDFIPVSNTLFSELKEHDKISSLNDWNKLQIAFISKHQYFTRTARKLREVNKQSQIERIKQLLE
jgi:adenylate cyclase